MRISEARAIDRDNENCIFIRSWVLSIQLSAPSIYVHILKSRRAGAILIIWLGSSDQELSTGIIICVL